MCGCVCVGGTLVCGWCVCVGGRLYSHTTHTPSQVKRRRGKTAQMEEDQLEGEWAYMYEGVVCMY